MRFWPHAAAVSLLALVTLPLTSPAFAFVKVQSADASPRLEEAWWTRHRALVARSNGTLDLAFLGDSLTQGWETTGKAVWERDFGQLKSGNFGIAGDQPKHLLWRIRNGEFMPTQPKVAVLLIGTNDFIASGQTPESTTNAVKSIVSTIRSGSPNTKIILHPLLPRGESKESEGRVYVDQVNANLKATTWDESVSLVDFSTGFLDEAGNLKSDLMPDMLHLSASGYDIWGRSVRDVIYATTGAPAPEVKDGLQSSSGDGGTAAGASSSGQSPASDGAAQPTSNDVIGPRFGEEVFQPSRQVIRQGRDRAAQGGQSDNAFASPSGPIQLGSVNATPPESYLLGPGDKITLRVSSALAEAVETPLQIDAKGAVVVPQSGRRLVVRGMTVAQAEKALTADISTIIRNPRVQVMFSEMRTFSVTILGEAFAPGTYQVPATFGIFNLILATGGPTTRGTIRDIQLRRNNGPARSFDLYKFLIGGQAGQDLPLQPGDVIYFPVSKGLVSVEGEVNRPAVFEILGGETLKQILGYAGGVRPSAVNQNVAIDSIVPGTERRMLNVDLSSRVPSANPPVNDGDKILVFSIRPVLRNIVSIKGAVEQPRNFALKPGMTVADLVNSALGLRPEADTTVAELRRVNPDGSRELIRVNLREALNKVPKSNILLKSDDTLTVFDVNDIAWRGERRVFISGAIRDPGSFYRADNMRVGDLIRQGKGLQPEAYAQEAHIQRTNQDGTPGALIKISPMKAALGDPAHDILLEDRDLLTVYKLTDWAVRPQFTVQIRGSVQRPETYPLAQGMVVRDLIEISGGFTFGAHKSDAYLQRRNPDGTLGLILKLNPLEALNSDPRHNLKLEGGDTLTIFSVSDWRAQPKQSVEVIGAVQRPGSFGLAQGMKVKDIISLSGGLTLDAHGTDAYLQRINPDGTLGQLLLISPSEALKDDPRHNLELQAGDSLTLYSARDWSALPKQTVEVMGAVQRPSSFGLAKGMKVKDLVSLAGGPGLNAYLTTAFLQRTNPDGTVGDLVAVDLSKALNDEAASNLELRPGDKLTVYTNEMAKFAVERTVTILGGVQRPGTYQRGEGMTLKNLLDLAGGLLPNSEPRALIAAANVPEGTNVQKVTVEQSGSWLIKDKDTVTVPLNSAILAEPIQVIIQGAVANPGVYFFTRRDQTITDLIESAGGLRKEAWIQGAQMSRKPELLKTETQKTQGPRLFEVISKIQDDEYKRAVSRAEVDRLVFISSAVQGNSTTTTVPTGAGTTADVAPPVAVPTSLQTSELVTKARVGSVEALLGGNMDFNLASALRNPRSPHNVSLKSGDILTIPETPSTVMVDGPGVVLPRAFVFEKGKTLRDYLNMAGGFTSDADPNSVLIIRPGGSIFRAGPSTRMELGDVVMVPTKVMVTRLGSQREAFERTVRTISNAALVYGFFRTLTR
jgi:protein involved in polysaccharide export with SLBB domain/lysophospholipase L1-like esterase